MTSYLLDTNHLSPLITLGHPMRHKFFSHVENGDSFTVPIVVVSEFLFGIRSLPRAVQNEREWSKLRPDFQYIGVDIELADAAASLRLELRANGWQVGIIDAFIAVAALQGNYTLLTSDKDFSGVPDLTIENWRT